MKYPILLPNIFNHPFTYESDLDLKIGEYVSVPFGKNKLTGVVWDKLEDNEQKKFKLKKVFKKLKVNPLKKTTINFLNWFSEYNIIPSFLNGKNKDDLAPIITRIFPLEIPFQIISFFFFDIPECHTAGLKPKYSTNFCSN